MRRGSFRAGGVALAAALAACDPPPRAPAHAAAAPAPLAADAVVWSYDVRASADVVLDVDATFAGGVAGALRVDDDAQRFVEALAVVGPNGARPAVARDVRCRAPCRVRYRMRLGEAARALNDADTALAAGGAVVAPPSTWLLRPADVPDSGRYRFHVTTPAGVRFVSGVRPKKGEAATYEADAAALEEASYAAFGPLDVTDVGAPSIEAAVAPGLALPGAVVTEWARAEVAAIGAYVGGPPDDRAVLFFVPGTQDVTRGKTLGDGGVSVLVRVGTSITAERAKADDWVVAHELVHVAAPALDHVHNWFSEGLATYVEPVARARAGLLAPERVWGDLVDNLPRGLPRPGDEGLEGESDWGRVYWGGCLYFLLVDLDVRTATHGARGLEDAVRAWHAASGVQENHWPIERLLEMGDRATGTNSLSTRYARFAHAPVREDLAALFARLGVQKHGDRVEFDAAAPLAAVREAITRRAAR